MTQQIHKDSVNCFVTCFIDGLEVNPGIRTGVTCLVTTKFMMQDASRRLGILKGIVELVKAQSF